MAMSCFGDNPEPQIYKEMGFIPSDEDLTREILMEICDNENNDICVIRDYKTEEILFLCSYDTWDKMRIGDIKVEIRRMDE